MADMHRTDSMATSETNAQPSRSPFGRAFAGALLAGGLAVAAIAIFGGNDSSSTVDSTEVATGASSTTQTDLDDAVAAAEAADADIKAEADLAEPTAVPAAPAASSLAEAPPYLGVTAELTDLDGWLQSDIDSLADLDGKVHVVQFWTFGCHNCKATLANLAHIYETYDGGGEHFEVVGVHAPEFEYEKDPDAILAAAEKLNVTWPIALDTNKKNFRSWQESRRFWPRTYVIDQNGDIRFDRIGEGAYQKLEDTVAWLLENGPGDGGSATTS